MESKEKIKVDIISGFLGAGKTTLIKKIVSEGFRNEKIFVLENEFGKVGIDSAILENSNIKVTELNSGCICCSPLLDFMDTLQNSAEEFKPDRIIIEPTGVAKLSEILSQFVGKNYNKLVRINIVITIVDVKKYKKFMILRREFFEDQIKAAKTVILSKVETADSIEIENVIKDIERINPEAHIILDSWEQIDTLELIDILEGRVSIKGKVSLKMARGIKGTHLRVSESAEESFMTFETTGIKEEYAREELMNILEQIKDENKYGIILRGKGIIKSVLGKNLKFDYVGGDINIEEFSGDLISKICFIGIDLKENAIGNLLKL